MTRARQIWFLIVPLGLAGAAFFIIVLVRHHLHEVLDAMAAAGWGLAAVVGFEIVPLWAEMMAWRTLFPPEERPGRLALFWKRWVGKSVSTLLPAAQVGGDLVRARLAIARGSKAPVVVASVLGDITISIFAQTIFTLVGVALLVHETQRANIVRPALIGSAIAVVAIGGFYVFQRYGMFRLIGSLCARLARSGVWQTLVDKGQTLDCFVQEMYARRSQVLVSGAWTFVSWCLSAVEVWIALWALGMRASYIDALILESVAQGVRSALFLVPAALGVQEGGYLLVGGLLGMSPETALALALIRRVRELASGIPGIIVWQVVEGHLWWRSRERAPAVATYAERTAP